MITIEKGVPLPEDRGFTATLRKMEIGDSFVAQRSTRWTACAAKVGIKIMVRKQSASLMRVWRVA